MTEATAKRTAGKRPARKPDPVEQILAEVKRRTSPGSGAIPLHGGADPKKGRLYHAAEMDRWFEINRTRDEAGNPGHDGRLLESVYFALSQLDEVEARDAMIGLAAHAVKIAAVLPKGPTA
ncbi:hypothetical protein ACGFZ9_09515 [Streptomyces mirabilis]|uniref:hypothetical protein n=1 Tax=Streptomyces mirabilis TaxID=68239 RepID=UPI0037206144